MKKRYFAQIYLCYVFCFVSSSQLCAFEHSHVMKGSLAEKRGEYEVAIQEYKNEIAKNPNFIELYISIGNIYRFKLKNTSKAIQIYLCGLEVAPNSFDLNLNIMYCHFEQGDFNKGIKHYNILAYLRGEKDNYSFPRDMLEIEFKEMDQVEQLNFCNKYLTINPTDIILREILAKKYIEEKDYKNAKMHYEAMIQYGVETGFNYFSLGVCDYYLENYQNSLKSFLKAKELGSYIPQSYFDMLDKKINLETCPSQKLHPR